MPHPYVDSATLTGKKITFRVEVTEFGAVGGDVEISGNATQNDGAFANIYDVVPVPTAPNGTGDDQGRYFVDVTADTIPPDPFKEENVTVYVKVSRAWVTVLGKDPVQGGGQGAPTVWDQVKAGTQLDGTTRPPRRGS